MKLTSIIREMSKVLLQLAAMAAIVFMVIQTTPQLDATPLGGLTEMRDARSFHVV